MEKLKKPLFIVAGCLVAFIIFMFLLASCSKKKYTSEEFGNYLVEQAKSYYQIHKDMLPSNKGGKTSVSISTLVEKPDKLLKNDVTCNGNIDISNNNGYYMYTQNINCSDGYKSTKLTSTLTDSAKIVSSGNGLYQINDYYIYRGESVNNYLVFNKQLWRIVKINSDGSLKIIETNYKIKSKNSEKIEYKIDRRTSAVWDDRYNTDKNSNYGFNDYIHEGINSRIKDTLESIYNEYSDDTKAYIVPQNICIGKRAPEDAVNDGSIECSNILNEQYVSLLQLNEYINASLDITCNNATSSTCTNYNYLTTFNSTFWTITASNENSYSAYKVGNTIVSSTTNSTSTPRLVINLSSDVTFTKGDGTYENPYIIN